MNNEHQTSYRGCAITTRWSKVSDRPVQAAAGHASSTHWFAASYSVAPQSDEDSWQRFSAEQFDSAREAVANALAEAMRSIDDHHSSENS